jgi:hypothetical protein
MSVELGAMTSRLRSGRVLLVPLVIILQIVTAPVPAAGAGADILRIFMRDGVRRPLSGPHVLKAPSPTFRVR